MCLMSLFGIRYCIIKQDKVSNQKTKMLGDTKTQVPYKYSRMKIHIPQTDVSLRSEGVVQKTKYVDLSTLSDFFDYLGPIDLLRHSCAFDKT